MKWDGQERRKNGMYDESVKTDIALIRQKMEFIEEKVLSLVDNINVVKDALNEKELISKKEFDAHSIQDRWMFGLIITILIGIFVKVIFN